MVGAAQSLLRPLLSHGECVRHDLYRDARAPDEICYVEEWTSADALHEEIRSPRFVRLMALMESAAEAPSLQIHYVHQSRGLDLVAELRGRPSAPEPDGREMLASASPRRRVASRRVRAVRPLRR